MGWFFNKEKSGSFNLKDEVVGVLSPEKPKDTIDILRQVKDAVKKKVEELAEIELKKEQAKHGVETAGFVQVVTDDINQQIHYDLIVEILTILVKENRAKKITTDSYIRI